SAPAASRPAWPAAAPRFGRPRGRRYAPGSGLYSLYDPATSGRPQVVAGGSDDQVRVEDPLAVPVAVAAVLRGLLDKELGRGPAQLIAGLPDRRQRHGRCGGEVDVVVADDRQVLGDAEPPAGHLLQHTEGYQVVGAEGGRGPAVGRELGDLGAGGATGGDRERRCLHPDQPRRRKASRGEGSLGAVVAVGDLLVFVRGAGEGDPGGPPVA